MSSLPPTTVYRIALLQSGLGDNGNNIEGLINQLKLSCSLFASNSFEIDMSHYNPLTEDFCNDNGSHSNTYEQYNHLHILKNQETIGTIIGLLFS